MSKQLTKFQGRILQMIQDSSFHKHFFISLPRREGKTTLCRELGYCLEKSTFYHKDANFNYFNVIIIDDAEILTFDEWAEIMIWATTKTKKLIAFGTVSCEDNTFTKLVTSGKDGCYQYTMDHIPEESRITDIPEIFDYFLKLPMMELENEIAGKPKK